jgi:hypothetical protein
LKFLTAGHSMNALMKRVSAPIPNHADHWFQPSHVANTF